MYKYELKESDWKVFKKKIPEWQNNHYSNLNKKYIGILQDDSLNEADRYWKLDKEIKEDKKKPGVYIDYRRSKMEDDIIELLLYKVIDINNLEGFSEELIDYLKEVIKLYE